MNIDTSKIETVVCPHLKLRFPTVYRIVESATREQLYYYGVYDVEPYTGLNYYSLKDDGRYFGTIEQTAISTLDASIDHVSLVIHHHRSRKEALKYLQALYDFGADDDHDLIFNDEEGAFTLITRPTRPSWPGPLII